MYDTVKSVHQILGLIVFAPLAASTARFLYGVEFPYDFLAGAIAFVVAAVVAVKTFPDGSWQLYTAGLGTVLSGIAVLLAYGSRRFEFLISGESWVVCAFVWLLLSYTLSLEVLIKRKPRPVT